MNDSADANDKSMDNNNVFYYRSSLSAIFALLQVNRENSAALMRVMEKCDPNFNKTVDVRRFSYIFCGLYVETMLYLWMKFNIAAFSVAPINDLDGDEEEDGDDEDDDVDIFSFDKSSLDTEQKQESAVADDYNDEVNESAVRRPGTKNGKQKASSPDDMFITSYERFLFFWLFFSSRSRKELMDFLFYINFYKIKCVPKLKTLLELVSLLSY